MTPAAEWYKNQSVVCPRCDETIYYSGEKYSKGLLLLSDGEGKGDPFKPLFWDFPCRTCGLVVREFAVIHCLPVIDQYPINVIKHEPQNQIENRP